jgi:hypothetical protein
MDALSLLADSAQALKDPSSFFIASESVGERTEMSPGTRNSLALEEAASVPLCRHLCYQLGSNSSVLPVIKRGLVREEPHSLTCVGRPHTRSSREPS